MPLNLKGPRAVVERLIMVDECVVDPAADLQQDELVWDEDLGDYVGIVNALDHLYEGPCNISSRRLQPTTSQAGGAPISEIEYTLSVPVEVPLFPDESLASITFVHEGGDHELLDKWFLLTNPTVGTYLVQRNYQATRYVQRP